jgi:hypothetical protein
MRLAVSCTAILRRRSADDRDRIAQGEQKPIRGRMQDEAHLVGFRPVA